MSEIMLTKLVKNPDEPCISRARGCTKPGLFVIDRGLDTCLVACADDLGSILALAKNVVWPPRIEWLGVGDRPPHSKSTDAALQEQQQFAREFADLL